MPRRRLHPPCETSCAGGVAPGEGGIQAPDHGAFCGRTARNAAATPLRAETLRSGRAVHRDMARWNGCRSPRSGGRRAPASGSRDPSCAFARIRSGNFRSQARPAWPLVRRRGNSRPNGDAEYRAARPWIRRDRCVRRWVQPRMSRVRDIFRETVITLS